MAAWTKPQQLSTVSWHESFLCNRFQSTHQGRGCFIHRCALNSRMSAHAMLLIRSPYSFCRNKFVKIKPKYSNSVFLCCQWCLVAFTRKLLVSKWEPFWEALPLQVVSPTRFASRMCDLWLWVCLLKKEAARGEAHNDGYVKRLRGRRTFQLCELWCWFHRAGAGTPPDLPDTKRCSWRSLNKLWQCRVAMQFSETHGEKKKLNICT